MADVNHPNWLSPAAADMRTRWLLCRDIKEGTQTLRDKKSDYLPRFQAEHLEDWDTRVKRTFAYDAFYQTVTGLVGLGLKYDPELGDDVLPELATDWENLDGEGNHGAVLAQYLLDDALTDGHVVLLTDHPRATTSLTLEQQIRLGIRPYAVRVRVDQILSWRVGLVGGRRVLLQFVFREDREEEDGALGITTRTRYRVYRQEYGLTDGGDLDPFVTFEVWEDEPGRSGPSAPVMVESGRLIGPTQIPVAVIYGGQQTGILKSRPPLLGLAYSNIHWAQVQSDRSMALHKGGMAIPVFVGLPTAPDGKAGEIKLSYSEGVRLPVGGDFKFAEPTGAALAQQLAELQEIEKRMAAQGLAMLQRDTAIAETATAQRIHRAREESKLARAVRSLEDGLEQTLLFMSQYRGLPQGGSVSIRRDFGTFVDPATLTLLSAMEERGQLTLDRLLVEMKRAGALGNDFVPGDEAKALEIQRAQEPAFEPALLAGPSPMGAAPTMQMPAGPGAASPDVQFMAGMIPHHAQAIAMAQLAARQDAGAAVQAIAAGIIAAQEAEIAFLRGWLATAGQPAAAQGMPMAGGPMPGMVTAAQEAALGRERGAAFDRLFLTYMIQHHRGALAMVDQLFAAGGGQDPVVFAFATAVQVNQSSEIVRMEHLLADLPAIPSPPATPSPRSGPAAPARGMVMGRAA